MKMMMMMMISSKVDVIDRMKIQKVKFFPKVACQIFTPA